MDAFNSEDFPPVLEVMMTNLCNTLRHSQTLSFAWTAYLTLPNSTTFSLFQQIQNKYDSVSALEDLSVLWRIKDLLIVWCDPEVL